MDFSRLTQSSSLSKLHSYDNLANRSNNLITQKGQQTYLNSLPVSAEINLSSSTESLYLHSNPKEQLEKLQKLQNYKIGQPYPLLINNQQKLKYSVQKRPEGIISSFMNQNDKGLQNGNLLNRSDKIGSKIKYKAQMSSRNNTSGLHSSQMAFKTVGRPQENGLHIRQQAIKQQKFSSWVIAELSNLSTRISKFDEKIDKLEGSFKKSQDVNQKQYQQQMQQINNILNLVQRSQKRNDSLKMMKMQQEMQQNILELHLLISNLQNQQQTIKNSQQYQIKAINNEKTAQMALTQNNSMLERIVKLQQWQSSHSNDIFMKKIQTEITKQSQLMKDKIENLRKQLESNEFKILKSGSKFEGRMISLLYEQRLIRKQDNKNVVIFQQQYYLDVDGYLLDKNCTYLLNKQGQSIHLKQSQIELLRKNQLL